MSRKQELEKVDLNKVQYLFGKKVTITATLALAAQQYVVPYHASYSCSKITHHYDIKETVRSMLIAMAIRIYVNILNCRICLFVL